MRYSGKRHKVVGRTDSARKNRHCKCDCGKRCHRAGRHED
nr:MAG TPA: hypothetical protein [Caudoviricetes sp.]